ncbi:MAG: hypothetical protein R3211_08030 [Balneolaceae bacterium]|nr:hypothetical protein [Balneolaceae bacterium]
MLPLILLLACRPVYTHAQLNDNAGAELQVYPAGIILGIQGGLNIGSGHELQLRVGYNITDRGDFGEHDEEEGGGPGAGLGYRHFLENTLTGLFLGGRADIWFMDIDWRDESPTRFGSSQITVLQPTIEAGYDFLQNSSWKLMTTISFGFEINVRTEGEEVGEGAIFLGGLNVGYRF